MRRPSAGAMLCFLLPQAAMLQLAEVAHAKVIYRAKCSSDRKMPNTNSGTKQDPGMAGARCTTRAAMTEVGRHNMSVSQTYIKKTKKVAMV